MAARILDGKTTARAWRRELKERAAALAARDVIPGLAVVRVGDDPASEIYVANKQRACDRAGMQARVVHLERDAGEPRLIASLEELAADGTVHGIILQLPLPAGYDVARAQACIPPAKDVDGLHPENQGLVAMGRPRFVPATPLGIVELLARHDIPIAGRRAAIVGRSAIVGRPLANLLSAKGARGDATVTLCHSRTPDLGAVLREVEIVVVAVGVAGHVTGDELRPGAVVIDVGMNRIDDPTTERGYRLCGDVDFASASAVASAITPVPGGVGPMTVAGVVHNTLLAAERAAGPARPGS
jgi:methylenetetrahydrofolate dehydrogenase (NADP+)/methenyltetrahydrofolate cyclohydrolase